MPSFTAVRQELVAPRPGASPLGPRLRLGCVLGVTGHAAEPLAVTLVVPSEMDVNEDVVPIRALPLTELVGEAAPLDAVGEAETLGGGLRTPLLAGTCTVSREVVV